MTDKPTLIKTIGEARAALRKIPMSDALLRLKIFDVLLVLDQDRDKEADGSIKGPARETP
jgi:hypothetical protein